MRDHQRLHSTIFIYEQKDAQGFWNALSNIPPHGGILASGEEIRASIKVGVKNLDVLQVIKESQLLQDTHILKVEAHGGLGHGLCKVNLTGASVDVVSAILTLRNFAVKRGGYAVVSHLPLALRQQIEVWGEKPAHYFLFEGIKTRVDPKRILHHKRFVGGI